MLSNNTQALISLILPCIFACSSAEDRQKKQEDLALSLAMQSQDNQPKKNEAKENSAVAVSKKKSVEKVDIALGFKGLSTQYQGYFRSEEAVKILENGLDLPSPVFVEVRWLDVGNNRGTGEIIVYVEKSIKEFSELQLEANTLMDYRKWLGANLDLRILAFDLILQGDGCRVPIVKHSALQEALISPCLERDGEKICAEVQEGGERVYSPKLKTMMGQCFHDYDD